MDELNQNESAVIEETAEHNEAMKCDSCGNHGGKQKNNNSNLLKAGIALMFATSVLSLGVSCYQIFSKDDNKVEQAQNMIGSVNDKKDTFTVSDDGYLVVNGTKTDVKVSSIDGTNGVSVVDARVIELDKWGITTQILFTMSDGSYVSTSAQKQVLSEHFYEAESVNDIVRLATEFKVPNIRLSSNLTLNESIDFAKSVCFDLNGKTLTYTAEDALTVGNNATLKFKNGTVNFNTEVAVSVEGTNAGVAFDGVKVNATAVVAETLEENASIKVVNSTITTVEAEVANFAFGSYESLFVVKGANAEVVVKETKVTTDRVIVAAKEDAEKISLSVESTKLNTSAPVLDINTDEVVPTLDIDEETLHSNYVELNTSTLTSGNFNFDPAQVGAFVEGETFDVDGKVVIAEDFTSLVEIVEAGATINLTRDIDLPTAIELNKKLTLDLCGYRMTLTQDTEGYGVFYIVEGGDLTINDSGRMIEIWNEEHQVSDYEYVDGVIDGVGQNNYSVAMFIEGGKLTINGGIFTNVGAQGNDPTHFDLLYVKGGELVINDGVFLAQTPKWTINIKDNCVESSKITVKGGYFFGYNPAEADTEPAKYGKLNFVAEGYMVGGFEGMYAVVEADADLIKEAIAYGELDYLAINADITLDETITVSNNLKINLLGNTITATHNAEAFKVVAGNVVVDNGTINAYHDAFLVTGYDNDVTLTLGEDLTVTSQIRICVYIKGPKANLITSANLKSFGEYATISGNGNKGNEVNSIAINGGTIEHETDLPIYVPQACVINVTGGTIKGYSAFYIKCGELNISGGRFIATGAAVGYVYNGSGGNVTGDALIIDACGYPGGYPVVTITGGTFESANANGIAYYSYKDNTAEITANGYEVATYVVVTTEAELVAAVANQSVETIILGSNITLTSTITVARNVTINLGGKILTATHNAEAFKVVAGNVVVDNGTINAYHDAFLVTGYDNDVTLTLGEDLTVTSQVRICVYIKGPKANLITSANLKSFGEYATISGNGNKGNEVNSIVINGGTIEHETDLPIYVPQACVINVTGGTIKGYSAFYIKCGELNISGGRFIATGAAVPYKYNGSGGNVTGDALIIDSCGYPGGYPTVTITGGTFEVADSRAHGIAYYIYNNNNAIVTAPSHNVYWLPISAQ